MPQSYELTVDDEIDLICFHHYGFSRGAVEAVLAANPGHLALFDDLGRVASLEKRETIVLPDIPEPTKTRTAQRLFN
jgi:phage tail protein X